jgi:hypothetical protein
VAVLEVMKRGCVGGYETWLCCVNLSWRLFHCPELFVLQVRCLTNAGWGITTEMSEKADIMQRVHLCVQCRAG